MKYLPGYMHHILDLWKYLHQQQSGPKQEALKLRSLDPMKLRTLPFLAIIPKNDIHKYEQ